MSMKFEGKKAVVKDLGFKPELAIGNLCRAFLKSVNVIETKVEKTKEDGSQNMWEYAGYTVPNLQFVFVQQKESEHDRDRILKHTESCITFTDNDGKPVVKETYQNLFMQMNDRIVHIHDAFKRSANYKELPDIDFDEKGDAKTRLERFKVLFTAMADAFNKGTNDLPIYISGKGEMMPVFLKVLPDYNSGSFYALPTFVNKGFIERNFGQAPAIELTPAEKANFELKSKKGSKNKGGDAASASNSDMTTDKIDPNVEKLLKEQGLA